MAQDPAQAGDIHHLEEALDTDMIKKRSITGALAYTFRTFLLQGIGISAFLLLAAFLSESEFGIFFIVDATVSFLVYFSDIGLGAALIQKKERLTQKDLATTFTIQQILVSILVFLALVFSKQVVNFYDFGPGALWLFRALVVSFFLSSLKTIPSILLERDLKFNYLILPQILENITFYGLAVYLAWKGFGITSYTYAVFSRAVVGLVAIYILKPWIPRFGIDKKVAKQLIKFGAPFQLNSILALFKDKVLIIFLGKVLTPTQVGILGWAEKWALMPIRFFAEPVLKVTFPAYSRLQDKPQELKKAIEKSTFFVSLLVFPTVIGMIALAPTLLSQIPKYHKWTPAIFALTFYGFNAIFSSVSITLTNTLNATGKIKTTLKLMVMWTTLTWGLTPLLINLMGYNGVALASMLTASSSMIAIYLVNKIVKINIFAQLFPPAIASFLMFILLKVSISYFQPTQILHTLLLVPFGGTIYFASLIITSRHQLSQEFAIVKKYFRHIT